MLSKLLKKDLQATARTFLPLMLGFVLVSILAKILFEVVFASAQQNNHANAVLMTLMVTVIVLYGIYIIACFIMTYVFIISDFYKTMVSNQGYLTHTLPVKTSTLINSKLIIAVLWQLVVFIIVALSFLLFLAGHMNVSFQEFIMEFESVLGISIWQYIGFMVGCMLAGVISGPLMFYASIAIGHLFGIHKVLGAILSYFAIYTVMQIISVVGMVGLGWRLSFNTNYMATPSIFSSIMWFAIIFAVISSIIFYVITNYVLSKKLNLE